MWIWSSVIVPLLVLGLLIFVHELGHFLLAKLSGVGVVKFSIGFGPAILKFRKGETLYQVSAVPLGGFVRMVGDLPDFISGKQESDEQVRESDDAVDADAEAAAPMFQDRSRWFIEKGFLAKSAIVIAGPLFNFLFAVLTIAASVFVFGEEIPDLSPRIGTVMKGSPAEAAGLSAGDLVTSVNGTPINSWEELATKIHQGEKIPTAVAVQRNGEALSFDVYPQKKELPTRTGNHEEVYLIGIEHTTYREAAGALRALEVGGLWSLTVAERTYAGLWGMVTGAVSAKDLAGPIFIFDAAGKQARKGLEDILGFMALLSVSLAVLNLLPIPVLDGGHLMFFVLEGVLGPISIKKKEFAQQLGMLFLFALMLVAISNDLTRPKEHSEQVSWEKTRTAPQSPEK